MVSGFRTSLDNSLFSICLILLAVLSVTSCSSSKPKISIEKIPIKLETRYIEDLPEGEQSPIGEKEQAATDWKFGCKTDFEFDVIDKSELASEYLVTVKIKSTSIKLDAPITIWISREAPNEVASHEKAHVEICKRVYAEAEPVAREGALLTAKKTFQGAGQTFDDAIKDGLLKASREICRYYHLKAVEKVNRVSETFDVLDQQKLDKTDLELVDMAFSQYSVVKK